MLPIDPTKTHDASYRYKMPPIQLVKSGANTTVFTNFAEVCSALQTVPAYCGKFLGVQLATSIKHVDSQLAIKGHPGLKHVQDALYAYIEKYILCPRCRLPELRLYPRKDKIRTKCDSCGHTGKTVNGKVDAFILKHSRSEKTGRTRSRKSEEETVWQTDFDAYITSSVFKALQEFVNNYITMTTKMVAHSPKQLEYFDTECITPDMIMTDIDRVRYLLPYIGSDALLKEIVQKSSEHLFSNLEYIVQQGILSESAIDKFITSPSETGEWQDYIVIQQIESFLRRNEIVEIVESSW